MTQTSNPNPNPFAALTNRNLARQVPPAAPADPITTAQAQSVVETAPVTASSMADADGVIPAPAAATPAVEATAEPMRTMAVVVSHADSGFAKILAGVVGEVKEGKFTIDPAYAQIAHLFTLAASGSIDTERTDFELIAMPEADVSAFRANMIRGAAAGWDKLYAQQAAHLPAADLGARMLASERNNVSTNVEHYVASQQLGSFDVPFIARMAISQPDGPLPLSDATFRATEADLLKEGHMDVASLQINGLEEVVTSPQTIPPSAALPEHLRNHTGGFDVLLQTTSPLLAANGDQAMRIAMNIMTVVKRNISMMQNVLTYGTSSIQNADMVPFMQVDDEETGWHERDN